MVRKKRIQKYMTRIGQKTGTLKNSKKVQVVAIKVDFMNECLNLNIRNVYYKNTFT